MKKERESNYELMRIISMFFIVVYHMLIITGGQLITNTVGISRLFLEFISLIMIVHVNSFVLISGYYQYDKKAKISKVSGLIGMALFYTVTIALIVNFTGIAKVSFLDFIKIFSPLEFNNLWFLDKYIALYLISPYLNILIEKLSQKEHRKMIIVLLIIFSIIPTITNQNTFANNGHTIIQFLMMYIIGAYLKKYPISENIHFKNYSRKKKTGIFFSVFIIMGSVNFLLFFFSRTLLKTNPNEFITYVCQAISDNSYFYQNPIIIIQSIAYFLIFENIKIKSKIINNISSNIFAIYVITETPYILFNMYHWLGINNGYQFESWHIIIKMLIESVGVFIACIIIEMIRKKIMKIICKIRKKITANLLLKKNSKISIIN